MSAKHGDIRSLEMAITAEARQDATRTVADALSRAGSVKQQAQERVNAQGETILRQAREKVGLLQSQAVTSAQLEAQALKLKHREQLLIRVMDEARHQLALAVEQPDYVEIVRQLIREGVEILDAESLVILADEKTRCLLDEGVMASLEKELAVQLELGELLERGTGVVIVAADGHRRYDNTLETRLSRMEAALRTPVHHILMGATP